MLSDVQCILNFPPSWTFVNGLLNNVVKELNVEEALKLSILVVQKAADVADVADVARGLRISTNQRPRNYLTHTDRYTDTQRIDILSGPALRAAPAKIRISPTLI